MFRNFVNPASLDRDGIRPNHPPDSSNTCPHPGQQPHLSHQRPDADQVKYSNHNGIPNGNDPAYSRNGHGTNSDHIRARIVQSSDSTGKGGGFTTSIFVNGSGLSNKKVSPSRNTQSHSSQHAQSSSQNHTPCPQSPHPGVHSTHAYTPLKSDDIGLAALSITEVEDEQQQFFGDSPSHAQYDISPAVFHNHVTGHLNHKDSRYQTAGIGHFADRPEDHRNGYTALAPSLYPIQDEQEEEESNDETNISTNDKNNLPNHLPPPPSQAVPCRAYDQKTFNVIPPPPPFLEQIFAGRRDVRDPRSVSEKQIVSAKGTVRGFKNRVKAGIATFWAQPQDQRNYRSLEQGKIVVYATSMCVVRETSERCKRVRNLLQNHMVRYEERDLYMSREIQQELNHRLSQEGITNVRLPHVFADGICIGGAEELERLNEAGELRAVLDNYQKIVVRIMCERCGGYRFVPCEICHGSKRSLIRNHFTEEFCALRCMHCDDSGLRRCDLCIDQQE